MGCHPITRIGNPSRVGDITMTWYPEGSTLCPYCYAVCTLVYKSIDKSIYECLKCKRETIVSHEEVDW
jgi:hypothetical protein